MPLAVKVGRSPLAFEGKMIAYKQQKGSYKDAGQLFTDIITVHQNYEIEEREKSRKQGSDINAKGPLPLLDTLGIYFENPERLRNPNSCRYIVGAILEPIGNRRDEQQQQREKNASDSSSSLTKEQLIKRETLRKLFESKGYTIGMLPTVDHVVYCEFLDRGPFSVIIGAKRVYPLMKEYIEVKTFAF